MIVVTSWYISQDGATLQSLIHSLKKEKTFCVDLENSKYINNTKASQSQTKTTSVNVTVINTASVGGVARIVGCETTISKQKGTT